MLIRWDRHAKLRFAERVIKLGVNYGDIEFEIKKPRVKIKQENERIKAIFKIANDYLTAIKLETKEFIHVITLWEASEKEVEIWNKK